MTDESPETEQKRSHSRRAWLRNPFALFVAGVLIGVLGLGTFRYFNLKSDAVHYHANFALYINGQRDTFPLPTFYEEVQACGGEPDNPRSRIHLHQEEHNDEDAYTVHVHDAGVTWGHLFANIGYTLGNSVLSTGSATYVDGQDGKRLSFYLNGEKVTTAANQTAKDKDVLLVSYGTEDDAALKKQYESIPHTAEHHDQEQDPATCSGTAPLTWKDRLRAAVGLNK